MPKAIWNGAVIADSDKTIVVEGNHYFPPDSIDKRYFRESAQTTVCPWKGTANYFDVIVGDQQNPQAAWYYADPKPAAANISGHVAFWQGVQVVP
jgi:uncharacterized protein (DUF427 family)